jgi:hypothetical protein
MAPLRAKSLGKLRLKARQDAREDGAKMLEVACKPHSDATLGKHLGGRLAGDQVRTGALVLTAAELAFLMPIDVAPAHFAELLRERHTREIVLHDLDEPRACLLRLIANRLGEIADLTRSLAALRPNS